MRGILQGRKQMIFQFELIIIEFIIKEGGINHVEKLKVYK